MCQKMALTHDWCIVKTLNSKLKLPWTPLWLNLPKIQLCIIVTFYQKFDLVSLRPFTKFWPCVIVTFYQQYDLVSLWPFTKNLTLCHCDLWEQLFCPWTGMHYNLGFDTIIHLTQIYEKEHGTIWQNLSLTNTIYQIIK